MPYTTRAETSGAAEDAEPAPPDATDELAPAPPSGLDFHCKLPPSIFIYASSAKSQNKADLMTHLQRRNSSSCSLDLQPASGEENR